MLLRARKRCDSSTRRRAPGGFDEEIAASSGFSRKSDRLELLRHPRECALSLSLFLAQPDVDILRLCLLIVWLDRRHIFNRQPAGMKARALGCERPVSGLRLRLCEPMMA